MEIKEKNNTNEKEQESLGVSPYLILLIGLVSAGIQIFGYFESQFLNTYIDHILNLEYIYIGIMVSSSAVMGLIFLFVWGIISDNTRSKWGRRRPYLLFGGIISGIGIILFGISPNYFWCYFFDVIIIGIASNAYYAAQRVLIPDLIDLEYRGRVNGIVGIISFAALIIAIIATMLVTDMHTLPNPDPAETGNILTQEGHTILLSFGGITVIITGIIGFLFIREKIDAAELPPQKKFREELRETFNIEELKKQREFFKLILAMTIFSSGVSAIVSYIFNFIFSVGTSSSDLITIFGIIGPVLIISILLLGRLTDKIGRKRIIIPTIFISCIGFFMIPLLTESDELNVFLFAVAFCFVLIGIMGVMVPMNTWSQDLLPEGKKAQFLGIFNIVNTVSQIIGSMTAGIVATVLKGHVENPLAWIFAIVPIFFIGSIPLFLKVKETLTVN